MNKLLSALEELSLLPSFELNQSTIESVANRLGLSEQMTDAIVRGDQQYLEGVLGKEGKIVCLLVPAKEEDDDDDSEQSDENDDSNEVRLTAVTC